MELFLEARTGRWDDRYVRNSVVILGGSSLGNSPVNTYFKAECISKMIALSFQTWIGFFDVFSFFPLGHVGSCKSCEDGTLGICTQPAASPLPFSGTGIFVLLCVEAASTPVGGPQ